VVAVACGKGGSGGDKPAGDKPAGDKPSGGAPVVAPKKGVTGSVTLTGAVEGTFRWSDDLAVETCAWVADTKVGGLGLTMTDGKGAFIGLTATDSNEHERKIVFSSGKLKLPHAGSMTGSTGFELAGTQSGDDSTVSVTYSHATVTADGQSVTIDGQLAGNCKYSP
jgi:hypothetical protein